MRALSPQEQLQYQQQLARNTTPATNQNDTAARISRMFGPANANKPSNDAASMSEPQSFEPPEEERRTGVWSASSYQRQQETSAASLSTNTVPAYSPQSQSFAMTQNTPETQRNPGISQPQYTTDWTQVSQSPIQQVSGNVSDNETSNAASDVTLATQNMPPLSSPTETKPDLSLTPSVLIHAAESQTMPVQSQLPEIPAANQIAQAEDIPQPADTHDSGNVGAGLQNNKLARINAPQSSIQHESHRFSTADESETAAESPAPKYSDQEMPKFYGKGEQKGEMAEKSSGSLSFLPKSTPPILTVMSSLAIVLGVFFILVWLMKRASPRQAGVLPQEVFEKLGSVQFSPKMQMHLFRLGGKLVLVSVTPDGLEPVAEVTDPDEVVHLIGLCKQNDPKSSSAAFRKVLKQYTGERGPQQQKQVIGNYPQQSPQQQYPQQQMQQYPPQNMQQSVRRPVGMTTPAKVYQR